ncbi:HepT-like ribonuclease domain-containing protein [Flavobacterium sp. SUN046]|nr:HepT-like ribonuclease domain-containing protein [Flavobacterium sp. SUN046]MEC4048047.1 HepT-like ribonuclease domain-containing protein [Flavobacterium sp. SUN046]
MHAYDSISDEYIWSIIINSIPDLKIEIEEKINNSTL